MINNEKDARMIGYGAMLIEGLVGICALIAACALPTSHYYHITTSIDSLPRYQQQIAMLVQQDNEREQSLGRANGDAGIEPPEKMSEQVGENVQGRTSGAVTLAVGMAKIFDTAARNILGRTSAALDGLIKYWYHFAIMFEALFILTTIDTGTRVGRFLLQETMGKWIHPALGKTRSWPSAILATALMVAGWWYFMDANAMQAIWPMFGIANQMLAVMALAIASAALVHMKKTRYLWVTLLPMCFVVATTCTAAVIMLKGYYTVATTPGTDATRAANAIVSASCILAIVLCTGCVVVASFLAAGRPPRAGSAGDSHEEPVAAGALETA
jgi:carbon starvation protein